MHHSHQLSALHHSSKSPPASAVTAPDSGDVDAISNAFAKSGVVARARRTETEAAMREWPRDIVVIATLFLGFNFGNGDNAL